MPRGNDAKAAASELADKFSEGQGNAEELILAMNAERSRTVDNASLKRVDGDDKQEAVIDEFVGEKIDFSKVEGGPDEGKGEVLDASSRGGVRILTVEGEKTGRVFKVTPDGGKDAEGEDEDAEPESKEDKKAAAKRAAKSKKDTPKKDSE